MAWRLTEYLIEGVLDNVVPGKVTGWMLFAGMKEKVVFDLEGNFHRDIRGANVRLCGDGEGADLKEAACYMKGFSTDQKGKVGDMTAGNPPADYVKYPYFEWYSQDSGRCVIELEPEQIALLTQPIPACESDPTSRKEQAENMAGFLCELAQEMDIPEKQAVATGNTVAVEKSKKVVANNKIRGMKLLTKEIRENLPELYAQESKGGKAVVYLKMFTPDSGFTWWITEGSPIKDDNGNEVDFHLFGLVQGQFKELGYVSLNELEEANGPMGLPIERDLHWQPKKLEEIAPEMFKEVNNNE
jgi:exonuclease III